MANWSKSDLSNYTLEFIGVKPAGQAAESDDTTLCQAVIDSVFDQLDKLGLVTFASSAIPTWAQWPLVKWVGCEVAPAFGISGQRLAEFAALKEAARRELQEQIAGAAPTIQAKADFF